MLLKMRFKDITLDDIEYLVSILDHVYKDIDDLFSISFTELRKMIVNLDCFDSDVEYCSQKKLETILIKWNDFRNGE